MLRYLLLLVFLVISVFVGIQINEFPVAFKIEFPEYTVRTSLILGSLFMFISSMVVFYVLKFLYFLWKTPEIFSRNAQVRKTYKAQNLLRKGLEEMIAGHYRQAEKHLAYGGELAQELNLSSVVYFENAAIAADKQGAFDRRDQYLLNARKHSGNRYGNSLTEAEIALHDGHYAQAEKILSALVANEPKNPKIISLQDQLFQASQQWDKAWHNLSKLSDYLPKKEFEERKRLYAKALLNHSAAKESFAELEQAWKSLSADLRADKEMILQYAGALVENQHPHEAEQLLVQQIKKQADLAYIQALSQLAYGDFKQRLAFITDLGSQISEHDASYAIFLYAKAKIAFDAQVYDIALQTIEQALALQPTREAFGLLAQTLEALGQPEAALNAYRQSLAPSQALQGTLLPHSTG
ncbi:MAG: heme biosynthesis HemY N-terminal domain-containing protein [Cardiobacteriaceae bacterium]|nr:heme biosynthesis HemY N-terminal domain-containing protein [Cardiobacteriaceae bacterium]